MPSFTVSGVAFVTGGARGLGNAVAISFAREGCSAVAIVDILSQVELEKARDEISKHGVKCLAIRCDVTNEDEVKIAIEKTVEAFGRIDYAANFAGITGPVERAEKTPVDGFENCLRVNTTGVFLCLKHEILQMEKQEPIAAEGNQFSQRGAIVNCASVNSILSGATTASYSASKHAVVGITKASALESRAKNIRINALSPGFIWTEMSQKVATHPDPKLRQVWEHYESRQGRKAFPEEIGDTTVLLCSPKMGLVNAHNLVCDYGFVMNENPF